MKKGLALLLAASMSLSAFSSAFAAEMTAQEKFDALKAKGIFEGYTDGTAGLDKEMTRAEFAMVLKRLMKLEEVKPATPTFKDLKTDAWYYGAIEAAVKAGYINGLPDGTFAPSANVTYEQLAKLLVGALNLEVDANATVEGTVSPKMAGYVKAALDAGLITAQSNYKAAVKRDVLVSATYVADATLAKADAVAITSVKQTGTKKITVEFNRAVTAEEKAKLAFEVKLGFVPYNVTATYSEDNKSVVLENSFDFPAGDYTVSATGLEAKTVTVVAGVVTKIEIGATSLQKAANQDLGVKALNQFGEVVDGAIADGNINVYNGRTGSVTPIGGKIDLSGANIDDNIIVTVFHPSTGLSASKTFKVVAASTVTSMNFGPVSPLKDKTRISVNESDLAVAYTLVDQYGNKMKLPAGAATVVGNAGVIGDVYFYSSDHSIINPSSFAVDADGNLTLDTGNKAGTVVITAINNKSGASTSFSVKVEATSALKTFQISHPGVLVAANEDVKFPYTATDTFGSVIQGKDINNYKSQVTITSSNPSVTIATYGFDAKTGDLKLNFSGSGATTVYAWIGGTIAGQVNVDVKEAASPVRILGVKNLATLLAPQGESTIGADNLNIVDNYGRAVTKLPSGYDFTVAVNDGTADKATVSGKKITGVAEGTEAIKVELTKNGTAVANSSYVFTAKVIKASDVVSYELAAVPTLYASNDPKYAQTLSLTGKDASGNKVAIDLSSTVTTATYSNANVGLVYVGDTITVTGKAAGTATVAVWNGATKLAETTVTVSDAAPVATSAGFAAGEYTVSTATPTKDLSGELTVKDQYGVAITAPGVWHSSDISKATVSASGVVTKVAGATGEVTISFVTTNGVLASTKVVVE